MSLVGRVLDLPGDVIGRILSYLSLKEIAIFDNAVTCHAYRVSFLAAMRDQRVSIGGEVNVPFKGMIEYIFLLLKYLSHPYARLIFLSRNALPSPVLFL